MATDDSTTTDTGTADESPESNESPESQDQTGFDGVPNELQDQGYDPLDDDRLEHLPESVRARAPKDEDAIAWEEDFVVSRDDSGEVLPVWEPIPGTRQNVCVYPMTQGEIDDWVPDDADVSQLDDAQVVAMLKEFYVVPDFSEAGIETVADLEDFVGFGVDPALVALFNASGMDMARGMFAQNSQILELIEGNTKPGS